jgi:hypothetical protein
MATRHEVLYRGSIIGRLTESDFERTIQSQEIT